MIVLIAGCGADGDLESVDTTQASAIDDSTTSTDTGSTDTGSSDTGSSDGGSSDGGDAPEACDLLTEDDVTDVFGEPVSAGETNSARECRWSTENDLKVVNLEVSEPDLDEWRRGVDNDSWEPVSLGDEGYRGVGMFDTVEFRVGDRVIEVNVVFSTSGDADAALEELAERVAANT